MANYIDPIVKKPDLIKERLNEIFGLLYSYIDFDHFIWIYLFYIDKNQPLCIDRHIKLLEKFFKIHKKQYIEFSYLKILLQLLRENKTIILTPSEDNSLNDLVDDISNEFHQQNSEVVDISKFFKFLRENQLILQLIVNLILY